MQLEKAEYKKHFTLKESYRDQKAGYDWFDSGDKNIRFFQCCKKEKAQTEG